MKTSYHFNRNTVKQSSLAAPNKRMIMVSGFSVQVSVFGCQKTEVRRQKTDAKSWRMKLPYLASVFCLPSSVS
jgi:hypothetical protein